MRSLARFSLICALLMISVLSLAQPDSNTVNVTLQATLSESLTVTLNSGGSQSIASLTPSAVNAFNGGPVNVTTAWVLKPSRSAVALYAYFNSAAAAMTHTDTNNTVDIPAAAIRAELNGAGGYNPLSNTVPFGASGAGLQLFSQAIDGTNKNAKRTDTIALELDLFNTAAGQDMTQLPADVYNGTLHIQAQTTP